MKKTHENEKDIEFVEVVPSIFRKTLAYNDDVMMCIFKLEKDVKIPMHDHKANQIGYVVKGKMKFITESSEFIVKTGSSYVFDSYEKHAAKVLEDTRVVEVFSPTREEYI
ncbi:MAG: Cupin [Promethearchaeota archaeon]|nr:MAG: Cupin [Candidatus Lokiarchaeota archaeon]